VKVTGLPDILTQIVSGSLPSCSVVKPRVLTTLPGTVTGITTPQVLPVVVRVTAVIVVPLVVNETLGAQPSRAMRLANDAAMSSCLRVIIGHFTLVHSMSRMHNASFSANLQSHHLLSNNFYPDLEHGQLRRHPIDGGSRCSDVVQVCLMEHERIMVKAEKMSRVC